MDERQLELIKKIQQLQLAIEKRMDDALPKVFEKLSNQVIDLAGNLSLDAKDRAKTLREMIKLKKDIADTIVNNSLYQTQVAEVIAGFDQLSKLSNDYISIILDDFKPKTELYKAILETNIATTKDALLGAGIRNNFGTAIQEVLKDNIAGIGTRTQLNETLRKFIEGTDTEKAFLNRYIKQTTNDSVMTFNSEYIQTIADDLGVEYYLYSGTIISDTREFCQARAGRYFTKAEVEKWASLKGWQGRMAGTNSSTIFIYRGGYNCRHQLWPVAKEQYESAKERGRAGLR
jgi:predicted XRE-type DNA-binding protein